MAYLLLLLFFVPLSMPSSNVLRIYKFNGYCEGHENAKVGYSKLVYFMKNRQYYVNVTMTVKEDVEGPLKLDVVRCTSRDSMDTCEKFHKININNMCSILYKGNTPWATLIKALKPPLECPYKKGIYEAENVILDGANIGYVAISPNWFWKVTASVLHQTTKEIIMCVYLEGQVV